MTRVKCFFFEYSVGMHVYLVGGHGTFRLVNRVELIERLAECKRV